MIFSLGDILSSATEMAGGRTDWPVSKVSFYANMAYTEVLGRARYRSQENYAVNTFTPWENKYALPTDFDYEVDVMIQWPASSSTTLPSTQTITKVLQKRNSLQLDQLAWYQSTLTNYHAEYYDIFGDSIQFWPRPTSTDSVVIRYRTKAPALLQSTDTLRMDDRWHPAVLYKTVELLEASRGDIAAEAFARNRFLSYVASTPNDDALRQQARYGNAGSFPMEYFGYY